MAREGGIDAVVESKSVQLCVRAFRCNYTDDDVIKELRKEIKLKCLRDALDIWKDQKPTIEIAKLELM
jgi:hypothetical protein